MTSTFCSDADLTARLSTSYSAPADSLALRVKASELVDYATMGRAQAAWDTGDDAVTGAASTDLITAVAAHELIENQAVRFVALVGGAGLTLNTVYYVIAEGLTLTEFRVSATLGGDQVNFTTDITSATVRTETKVLITNATCDQVEYWLETGEEHDVLGLHGSLQAGRVQINRLPPLLGRRAKRQLVTAGLYYAGAPAG